MGDPVVPEGPGGRDAAPKEQAGIPAMPVISPNEQVSDYPYPLLDGVSPTVGWVFRSQAKGGPIFVILRRTGLGSLKVVESFPLTEGGWAAAWKSLVRQSPAAVPQVLGALEAREAATTRTRAGQELDARTLITLRGVAYLGGHVPESAITAGEQYDVRFLEDRLAVFGYRRADVLAEVTYGQVEHVEIGGPGLVKKGGGFVGGGFGVTGAIEGMAIAAVLNGLTARTSIKTIVRIQGTGCELFLLHTRATPDQLRIEMSRTLSVIRSARATEVAEGIQPGVRAVSSSPVEELTKLAGMLEKGLLTREEFDLMKAQTSGSRSLIVVKSGGVRRECPVTYASVP
jgi:hypothetical protein